MNTFLQQYYDIAQYEKILELFESEKVGTYYIEKSCYAICYSYLYFGNFLKFNHHIDSFFKKNPDFFSLLELKIMKNIISGDYTKACEYINTLEKIGYASEIFYIAHATLLSHRGEVIRARKLLAIALQQYPRSGVLSYNLANTYFVRGEYSKALVLYDASIGYSAYLYAMCKKITSLKQLGRKQEAIELGESILKNSIASEYKQESLLNDGHLIAGNILYELGRYRESLICYKKYLLRCNNDTYSLDAIGDCYICLEDYTGAIRYYKKSLSVNAQLNYPKNGIAKAHIKLGNIQEAIVISEKLIVDTPDNFTALFILGKCYYKKNNLEKSLLSYKKARLVNKTHHMCNRYISKLEKILGFNK